MSTFLKREPLKFNFRFFVNKIEFFLCRKSNIFYMINIQPTDNKKFENLVMISL